MTNSLIAVLFLLAMTISPQQSQLPVERSLVNVVQCQRVANPRPAHTGLNCGVDEKGAAVILDIPETVYQFPRGDVFRMFVYSDHTQEFRPEFQPQGSRVLVTPPCPKHVPSECSEPRHAGPCNPDTPQAQ